MSRHSWRITAFQSLSLRHRPALFDEWSMQLAERIAIGLIDQGKAKGPTRYIASVTAGNPLS
jgi:hypothetical protein